MYKYKKGFTTEEAALFAVGLNEFTAISQAKWELCKVDERNANRSQDEVFNGNFYQPKPLNLGELVVEAEHIKEVLQDELYLLFNLERGRIDPNSADTEICCHSWYWYDEYQDFPDADKSLITRSSLAKWFYAMSEVEKAKLFDPLIEQSYIPIAPNSIPSPINSCSLGKEATYQKIVGALTKALSKTTSNNLKPDGSILIGYDKDTGSRGIVGYLKSNNYSDLSSSTLADYISKSLKTID